MQDIFLVVSRAVKMVLAFPLLATSVRFAAAWAKLNVI